MKGRGWGGGERDREPCMVQSGTTKVKQKGQQIIVVINKNYFVLFTDEKIV